MIDDGMETQELVLPEDLGFKNDPMESAPYRAPDLGSTDSGSGLPLGFWIAIAAAVVVALVGIWLIISSRSGGQGDLSALTQRLERLESRVEILAATVEETSAKVRNAGDITPVAERLDRYQSEIGVKVDLLASSVGTLQKQIKKAAAARTARQAHSTAAPGATASPRASSARHTVKKGDTLYSISRQFKVSIAQLRQWNNLTSNAISVGQSLIVGKP